MCEALDDVAVEVALHLQPARCKSMSCLSPRTWPQRIKALATSHALTSFSPLQHLTTRELAWSRSSAFVSSLIVRCCEAQWAVRGQAAGVHFFTKSIQGTTEILEADQPGDELREGFQVEVGCPPWPSSDQGDDALDGCECPAEVAAIRQRTMTV